MKKPNNNGGYGEKLSQDYRAQPRKSSASRKTISHGNSYGENDDDKRPHSHRAEPAKNLVRMQLRQHLFEKNTAYT